LRIEVVETLNLPIIPGNVLRTIILSFLFLLSVSSWSQDKDRKGFGRRVMAYGQRFLNDSLDGGKARFLLYPVFAYSPETSLEVGVSGLYLYNARKNPDNRLSEIQAFMFATVNEQYGAWFDHFLYGHEDRWFFLGRLRFQRFPLFYYGVGPQARKEDETVLQANYTLIKERVLRKVLPDLFVGLELDYQQLYNVRFANEAEESHRNLPGGRGTSNLGLGFGIVYDSRHNPLNVRKGAFAELAYLHYDNAWGSEFSFNTVVADVRLFRNIRKNQVLALQASGAFMGGEVPFNQLAMLGGEMLMRGYYTGRFRDRNFVAAQAEYRWLPFPFSKRFGGVLFASAGTVSPETSMLAREQWHPAVGAGLRFLVFPKKDIFIRADFALTPEGTGLYIYTGEAF
jgi:hypothetical protein